MSGDTTLVGADLRTFPYCCGLDNALTSLRLFPTRSIALLGGERVSRARRVTEPGVSSGGEGARQHAAFLTLELLGGQEMMETPTEGPTCRGISAGSATRRPPSREACTGAAARGLPPPCNGCLLRLCAHPWGQVSASRRIVRRIKRVEFERGAVLYREDQAGTHLYMVRSGLVKLVQYSRRGGNERIVRLLHSGDAAGFECLLGGAYHHMAIALNAAFVCVIPRNVVTLLLDLDSPDHLFRTAVMSCWQRHLDTADQWLCGFAMGPAQARVARLICYLISIERADPNSEVRLLSRDDMASILGLASESVCREVSKLRSSGAVRPLGNGRYACNKALLGQIAQSTAHVC